MNAGVIMALDLGQRTGFAIGPAGEPPEAGVVALKREREPRAVAMGNLIGWLQKRWAEQRPELIFIEAPLNLQAFRKLGNAEATVRMTFGLAAIVEGMTTRMGIRLDERHVSTIRKHFLSTSNLGDRKSTKAAVVARCHLLGFLPRSCTDDNMADAIAAFDFASAHLCRKPLRLALFTARSAA